MPTATTGAGEVIHYSSPRALGEPMPGARILFIHGAGVDHRLFEEQLHFFSPVQTPVAIDLPGHGGSPGDAFDDVAGYRHVLEGFLEQVRFTPVLLCGHGLGGAIALDYAIHNPRQVEGLVLMDFGRTFPGVADSAADMLEDPAGYRARNGRRGLTEGARARAIELVTGARTDTAVNSAIRDLVAMAKWDATPRLAHLQTPTLLVYGEQDPLLNEADDLREAIPHASFDIIPLARHFPHAEMPDIFNDSLNRFINLVAELTPVTGGDFGS